MIGEKRVQEKDYRKIREIWGKRAGVLGLILNFLLFGMKLLMGILSGSVAITADAINNLSDMAASAITIIGFRLSGKPADEKHPYGHARMEYIAGLMISMILIFLGLQLLWSSVGKIIDPRPTIFSFISIYVLLASMVMKTGLWIFYAELGKRIHSLTLKASSQDSRNDVLTSAAVVFSLLVLRYFSLDIDGWIGAGLSAFIHYSGIQMLAETIHPLLGSAPPEKFVNSVSQKLLAYPGVIGFHDLVVHNYGYKRSYASVHVEVPANGNMMDSHTIIDRIERDFMRDMKLSLVIHMDPVATDDERTQNARKDVQQIITEISAKLSIHDFRAVWVEDLSKIIFDLVIPFDYEFSDEEAVDSITASLSVRYPGTAVVITVDHPLSTHRPHNSIE